MAMWGCIARADNEACHRNRLNRHLPITERANWQVLIPLGGPNGVGDRCGEVDASTHMPVALFDPENAAQVCVRDQGNGWG